VSTLSQLSPRDLEDLSAYLDGQLSTQARSQFEARLQSDVRLQRAARELRATVELVGSLPQVPPPRRFTLTPEMAGLKTRRPAYPAFRLATALATLGFLVTVGVDALTRVAPLSAMRAAAPAAGPFQAPSALSEALASPAVGEAPRAANQVSPTASAPIQTFGLLAQTPTPTAMEKTLIGLGGGAATQAATPTLSPGVITLQAAAPHGAGPGLPPAPCPDCTPSPAPTLGSVADQAQLNGALATEEGRAAEMPTGAPVAAAGQTGVPSGLRLAEISLAALAVVLGGLTLWLRRRPG